MKFHKKQLKHHQIFGMKILLDECVTNRLKKHLKEFEVFTVSELKISGMKNGQLMKYCVENQFDILLTIDKNLIFQQHIERYFLSIVVLDCRTSKIEELVSFLPSFKAQVKNFSKNKTYVIV